MLLNGQLLSQPVRVLILDVDGTLVTDDLHRTKHNRVLAEQLGLSHLQIIGNEWGPLRGKTDECTYLHVCRKAADRGIAAASLPPFADYKSRIDDYFTANIDQVEARAGSHAILAVAHAAALYMGVVTNGDRKETDLKLSRNDMGPFRAYGCFEVNGIMKPKPAPDLIVHVMKQAQLELGLDYLDPLQVLLLGDSHNTDVKAALTVGCRVIHWPNGDVDYGEDSFLLSDPRLSVARSAEDVIACIRRASGVPASTVRGRELHAV